jgi:uncharacterized protein (TIGR03118 family)
LAYRQTNFLSSIPGYAPVLDPLLSNPWGISVSGGGPFWIANNGTPTSQLIRGDVAGAPVVLNPGLVQITIPQGQLTGTVVNPSTTDFVVPGPCASPPCSARFLFCSVTGNVLGWSPNAPAAGSTTAVITYSNVNDLYTGMTVNNNGSNKIYLADFFNGVVTVLNSTYTLTTVPGGFADPTIPAGFTPFNVHSIGNQIYVTYALLDPNTGLDIRGVGNGYVRRFDANGVRDLTFAINQGELNSPWGVAIAPANFGTFSNDLLIGNFGEGNPSIHAYNPTTGAFIGTVVDESGEGIEIDELWALQVGNGGSGGDVNTLYFTAGPAEQQQGLFGSIKPTTASATSLIQLSTDELTIGEENGHLDVTVTRSGNVSGAAEVNLNTMDEAAPEHANQKSDYEIATAKVRFAPGETSKSVRILLVNDNLPEGEEVIDVALSNATGPGVGLGSPNTAELTVVDDDSVQPTTNPIDDAPFFVRQQYLDFLNREPDPSGFAFWTNEITSCGTNAACIELKRINVSAAFFLSGEFQNTGLEAYLAERAAFGPFALTSTVVPILYGRFQPGTQVLQKDYVVGAPGADAQLELNKTAFFNDFVQRPEFISKYPGTLTNAQYVDNLLVSAGLSTSNFIVNLTNGQENPPTNPTDAGGVPRPASYGTATFSINAAETSMTFNATITNLDFSSQTADANDNLLNAHIHAGPTVAPGVNGPVVWGFLGSPFNDNNPNDQVFTPALTGIGGTVSGKWDTPEGNNTTLTAQLPNLKQGRAYINFHTTQFTGGEIRGNFPNMTALHDSLLAGLNANTETRASVLRKVSEFPDLKDREFNRAFVLMEYFGYLRRHTDTAGFTFWFTKLNSFNGNFVNAEMVKAFLASSEYRLRFGPN